MKNAAEKLKASLEQAIGVIQEAKDALTQTSPWTPEGLTDAEYIAVLIINMSKLMAMLGWTRRASFAKKMLLMNPEKFEEFLKKDEEIAAKKETAAEGNGSIPKKLPGTARRRREGHRVRSAQT